jgi:phosphate transport system permease protein
MRGAGRAWKGGERAAQMIFFLCGLVTVGCVLGLSVYLVIAGAPAIGEVGLTEFLFGDTWSPQEGEYGILPFWLTSVAGAGGALLIGAPLGVLTAVFLVKTAPGSLAAVLRVAVSLLAGIPSVVYGLVGLVVLVPAVQRSFGLSSGANLLSAILVLSVMILPSVVGVTETALRAVPREYEEGSLALGATEMETVFRVSLPAARSGVATAVVLGVGRALGEAMAVIMVSGNVANLPGSLFTPVRLLTTAIASEMSYAPAGSLWRQTLFSIGLVLFLLIMLINVGFHMLLRKRGEG